MYKGKICCWWQWTQMRASKHTEMDSELAFCDGFQALNRLMSPPDMTQAQDMHIQSEIQQVVLSFI